MYSSLNQHLFSKNIVDSPLCDCGLIEDTTHYLLNCTRYNNIRQQMFNSVSRFCSPTLHTLLRGNSNLTNEQNKSIMIAVQEFITRSGRFKIQQTMTNCITYLILYCLITLALSMRLNRANFSFVLQIAKFSSIPPPPPRLSPSPPILFHYYWIGYLNIHVCFHAFFTSYTYCIVPNYLVNVLS